MSLQVHCFRANDAPATGTTEYISPINGQYFDSTEHRGTCICLAAGTFSNFKVVLPSAPGAAKSFTFTLRINQADTAAVITISDAATSGTYLPAITLADGDELTIKCVPSGTPTSTVPSISWDFNGSTSAQSIYGGAYSGTALGLTRLNKFLYTIDASNWSPTNATDIITVAGVIGKYTVKADADPGAGGSWVFSINKNGTIQDGSAGTPDTRLTLSNGVLKASATFTLNVVAGDYVTLNATKVSSPTGIRPSIGIKFTSTVAGYSIYGGARATQGSTSAVNYNGVGNGSDIAPNATEANVAVTVGVTGFRLENLYAWANASSSPGTYTEALRQNGNTTNLSCVVNSASIASDTAHNIKIQAGDVISLIQTPASSPASRAVSFAFSQTQLPGGGGGGGQSKGSKGNKGIGGQQQFGGPISLITHDDQVSIGQ